MATFQASMELLGVYLPETYISKVQNILNVYKNIEAHLYIHHEDFMSGSLRLIKTSLKDECHSSYTYSNVQGKLLSPLSTKSTFIKVRTLSNIHIYMDDSTKQMYSPNFSYSLSGQEHQYVNLDSDNLKKIWQREINDVSINWATTTYFGDIEEPWPGTSIGPNIYPYTYNDINIITNAKNSAKKSDPFKARRNLAGAAAPFTLFMAKYGNRANWLTAVGLSAAGKLEKDSQNYKDLMHLMTKDPNGYNIPIDHWLKLFPEKACTLMNTTNKVKSSYIQAEWNDSPVGYFTNTGIPTPAPPGACTGSQKKSIFYGPPNTDGAFNLKALEECKKLSNKDCNDTYIAGTYQQQSTPSKFVQCKISDNTNMCSIAEEKCINPANNVNYTNNVNYANNVNNVNSSASSALCTENPLSCKKRFLDVYKSLTDVHMKNTTFTNKLPATNFKEVDKDAIVLLMAYEACGGNCSGKAWPDCANSCPNVNDFPPGGNIKNYINSDTGKETVWYNNASTFPKLAMDGSCGIGNFMQLGIAPGYYPYKAKTTNNGDVSYTQQNQEVQFQELGAAGGNPPCYLYLGDEGKLVGGDGCSWCNVGPNLHFDLFAAGDNMEKNMKELWNIDNASAYPTIPVQCNIAGNFNTMDVDCSGLEPNSSELLNCLSYRNPIRQSTKPKPPLLNQGVLSTPTKKTNIVDITKKIPLCSQTKQDYDHYLNPVCSTATDSTDPITSSNWKCGFIDISYLLPGEITPRTQSIIPCRGFKQGQKVYGGTDVDASCYTLNDINAFDLPIYDYNQKQFLNGQCCRWWGQNLNGDIENVYDASFVAHIVDNESSLAATQFNYVNEKGYGFPPWHPIWYKGEGANDPFQVDGSGALLLKSGWQCPTTGVLSSDLSAFFNPNDFSPIPNLSAKQCEKKQLKAWSPACPNASPDWGKCKPCVNGCIIPSDYSTLSKAELISPERGIGEFQYTKGIKLGDEACRLEDEKSCKIFNGAWCGPASGKQTCSEMVAWFPEISINGNWINSLICDAGDSSNCIAWRELENRVLEGFPKGLSPNKCHDISYLGAGGLTMHVNSCYRDQDFKTKWCKKPKYKCEEKGSKFGCVIADDGTYDSHDACADKCGKSS